jgi:aspartate aminotransferase-like enzyme
VPWGKALTPALLRAALERNPDVKAVFLTHNETSTGVTNPLPELAAIVRDHGALVVVDAVSSAGGLPLLTDEWGLDFVLSGSQKAWMCPPGLTITAIGPRAWDAYQSAAYHRFFWDFEAARKAAARGMTPTTPPLTAFYAFDAALDMMLEEGIDRVWDRHAALGDRTRSGVEALGLALFADPTTYSNTVTAVTMPKGVSAKDVTGLMKRNHDVVVGAGQGYLTDAMVRIGHMGWCNEADIDGCLVALGDAVEQVQRGTN